MRWMSALAVLALAVAACDGGFSTGVGPAGASSAATGGAASTSGGSGGSGDGGEASGGMSGDGGHGGGATGAGGSWDAWSYCNNLANECPGPEQCRPEWHMCTAPCEMDRDCPPTPSGGTAVPQCSIDTCYLQCDSFKTCPVGMVCMVPVCEWP